MPPLPFAITRDGEPITLVPLSRTIRTGIASADVRVEFGLVPEYEERNAAVAAGYLWSEWLDMDMRDRAAIVAFERLKGLIALHSNDAIDKQHRREQALKKAGLN